MKNSLKRDTEWAYFGKKTRWENVEKPAELASIPRCTICELAVKLEKWPNKYCWNCWKICFKPDSAKQYRRIIQYAVETANMVPNFYGKRYLDEKDPVLVIFTGSERERDEMFERVIEDLKARKILPLKRWYRRGGTYLEPILGHWKTWGMKYRRPKSLSKQTINKILELVKI